MTVQVLCLGECLYDRIFDRYDGDQPHTPFWVDYPGGAPANVAVGLAKLGTAVGFIGSLGDDRQGDQLRSILEQAGVDCAGVQRSPRPTRIVLVHRDRHGERSFVGFSQPDPGSFADAHLDAQQLSLEWFSQADYLVMGTLGLAYPSLRQSLDQALAWAQDHGLTTVVDLNWRPGFWPHPDQAPPMVRAWVDRVDILKLNQGEAEWLFQSTTAAPILAQLGNAKAVLVTAGDQGCDYATAAGLQGYIPAFRVEAEDSTGAGDSFLAGFIHQLCQRGLTLLEQPEPLVAALRYASAAGALTTTQAGAMAAQPDARSLEAFLYLHPPSLGESP
ncbi:MAG: carbohydrate kinase [Cyanobacteriota bacterium]|nr:carbohydrate kinase [Cyanobacteriota bacterium]